MSEGKNIKSSDDYDTWMYDEKNSQYTSLYILIPAGIVVLSLITTFIGLMGNINFLLYPSVFLLITSVLMICWNIYKIEMENERKENEHNN